MAARVERKTSKRSEDRRSALISAALQEIGEACSLDVTVSQIAHRAGVSSALAHHYFGGKEDLLYAALRHILALFRRDVIARLSAAKGPRGRLSAVVAASFAPEQFNAETVAAWTIFYVKAQSSPRFAKLLRLYVARLRSNLVHELRRLSAAEPDRAAETIAALIDGLYLRQGLRPEPADWRDCVEITEAVIDRIAAPRG